ncbi:hypothetical protein MTTB_03270 [Methanothermobacter tenebrarum]|jgi:hypothetical protein|uniref:Type I-B CRISPR-associated protein Cas8b1/Cst1 n=1 Tax=Methanothermobacter tenebrarum TaxID=680118 RepID=A0ABM7YCJ9_9EURY|nr:hypothetical protein [Methanothermobacter tenebrarum]MDX9693783.1 hypothetical protein [Methanothermobacter sp.]BDH78948.1 hypothetical protein MTTB_03270 [Methanothermobacter tenebrarum]
MVEINFNKHDFLYDNGLVNILSEMRSDERFENIDEYTVRYRNSDFRLKDTSLEFKGTFEDLKEAYFILRSIYYSRVFEETQNYKPYYDPRIDDVVIRPKLNVKPFLQRSERTRDLLPKISVPKEKLEFLKKREMEVKRNFDKKIGKNESLQYGKSGNVMIHLEPEELGEKIAHKVKEIHEGDECFFCGLKYSKYLDAESKKEKKFTILSSNLIFDFGTGDSKPSFRDLRARKDITACFMCDLIYRYGLLNNYFHNNNVFIIAAPSLRFLYHVKRKLKIPADYLEESNNRSNFILAGDFAATDVYSKLLLLIYKVKSKILDRDDLSYLSIFYFIVTSRSVDYLQVYSRLSYISEFFEKTGDIKNSSNTSFLKTLINYAYYKNISKFEVKNLPRKELSRRILLGLPLDPVIMDLSFYNLSLDNPSGLNPSLLYQFLEEYLEVTKMTELKELHKICRLVGDRIGYFAAQYGNKDILYPLREIGNLEGLTEFFKNLEYEVMKEDAGAIWNSKANETGKKYSELIHDILEEADNNKKILLIKNYLAIYAIQKYLAAKYAKNKEGGN